MDENKNIIDLDALAPDNNTRIVKLGGQEIVLRQPKTISILRLGSLAKKMEKAADLEPDELNKLIIGIVDEVKVCIPEIQQDLSTAQLLKLVELLSEMAMPEDTSILEKNGITAETPKAQ